MKLRRLLAPDLRIVLGHIVQAIDHLEDLQLLAPDDVDPALSELRQARRLLSHR